MAGELPEQQSVSCADGCFWSTPRRLQIWRDPSASDAALLGLDGVEFQAVLVVPGASKPPHNLEDPEETLMPEEGADEDGLPIAFFFAGLGETPKDTIDFRYADFAAIAPEPFVLVVAGRQPGRWWFIDDDGAWGWIQGKFRPEAVELVGSWMQALAGRPGLNMSRVGLFGFSAGAYAAAELLASRSHDLQFAGVGFGGVHGHGQSDLDGLPQRRQEGVLEKFESFLGRLVCHKGAPWIEATHSQSDWQSRWQDASSIFGALTERQDELGLPAVSVRVLTSQDQDTRVGSRKNKAGHDYIRAAFLRPEFLRALLGGEAPEPAVLPDGLELKFPDASLERASEKPQPPPAPPPTVEDMECYSANCGDDDWVERAFDIFKEHGFVIVAEILKLHQYSAVLRDCERAAKALVGPDRKGNRGLGRYSFGIGSSTGSMLHLPSYTRHLLEAGTVTLRPLLDLIFSEGDLPGFSVLAGGGDFVLGDTHNQQPLHSDIQVSKALNKQLPPPMLSVNYCVQELTHLNGPTRMVPGTQLLGGVVGEEEPGEDRCTCLCPVPAGAAVIRDVRTLHGGTANLTPKARYLPSIEYVSADMKAANRQDMRPTPSLPRKLYDRLPLEVQELCEDLLVPEGEEVQVAFTRR